MLPPMAPPPGALPSPVQNVLPQQKPEGVDLYGNPVLDAPPFDESMFGDLVAEAAPLGAAGIDAIEMDMEPDMGAEMPPPDMGMNMDMGSMQGPVPESKPQNRHDMLNLLAKKGQARLAASEKFQAQAAQLNRQK